MLRERLDVACNEGALRSNIPIIVKQPGGQQAVVMDKIADRAAYRYVRVICAVKLRYQWTTRCV